MAPHLQDLMLHDLRWSWCNNNRNKVHNKCTALESSQNYPPTPYPWKNCPPWNQSPVPKTINLEDALKPPARGQAHKFPINVNFLLLPWASNLEAGVSPAVGAEGAGSHVALRLGWSISNSPYLTLSQAQAAHLASCFQWVAGNPFPTPPPQPRQAGVIPTEEVHPGQACPFPTAPESPSTAFLLNSRPRIPQGPYPGPMGLCCHWCCSLDRGQPSSHMTHINKSGRGGVVGKFINPYQTAPKLWQMTWQS